ncbi:elongation factor P [Algivirga pacifica]|uniref:Elongation factor P n=1 Tax=Algivirga pacifica TaxID=1162670 RepID=A0ABP9DM89_9BACT
MASTSDFRNGLCIEFNHDIYAIVEFQHVKPGKGPAFVRTKLKSIRTGKVIDNTFPSGHKVTTARIERRKHQFLYRDDMGLNFMDTDTYEQVIVQPAMLENNDLLKDGEFADILFHVENNDEIIGAELPQFVELEVVYTEPGVKGDTATNATKPVKLETGAEIQAPLFINQEDVLKIDTKTRSYVERVKR